VLANTSTSSGGKVPASKVAEHQYCPLKTYCEEVGVSPDKKKLKKQQKRMKKGTKEHEKVGKNIEKQKRRKEVSFLLLLISLGALVFLTLLGLLLWFF